LFFLIVLGVIAIPAAQNHRAGKSWMPEFAMLPLAAESQRKPRLFQILNQLADFARHFFCFDTT